MPDASLFVRVGSRWFNLRHLRYAWDSPSDATLTLCFGEHEYVTLVALERLMMLASMDRNGETLAHA